MFHTSVRSSSARDMFHTAERSSSSRAFVVACPTHPDVILTRQKRGIFGRRRVEVVQSECPLCVRECPFQGDDPPAEDWNISQRSVFQPTAPYAEHHTEFSPQPATTRVPQSPPRSNSGICIPGGSQSQQLSLTQSIMDMVHALLDRDNPIRGPSFVADQLEMLCAWSLCDPGVRLIMVDAGAIYIVVNVLQQCLERLPSATAADNPNSPSSLGERLEPSYVGGGGGETTLPTQTLDDASTILTNEAELEDAYGDFDSMYQDNTLCPHNNALAMPSLANDRTPNTMSSLSYPVSTYFQPSPRSSTCNVAGTASQPLTTNTMVQSFRDAQPQGPRASALTNQHHSIISPPPPTMNDIDRAFGHFLDPFQGASSTVDGNTVATPSYQCRPSYQGQPWHSSYSTASTQVMSTRVSHGAVLYAPSVADESTATHISVNRRQAPSVPGSSVSAYIAPRAPGNTQRTSPSHIGSDMDRVFQEARWAVATLANLSQDQASVDIIRSAKVVETLLGIMSCCESDEMLQDCGCECLSTLISRATAESRHIKGMITSYGGMSIVLTAMRLFPATPTLQHKCCLFILRMAASDPVVLQSIATLRGIELITLAMRLHATDQELQEASCHALVTLLREAIHLREEIISAQGVDAILTAMWQFDANGLLQSYGSESLGHLCANDDRNKQILVEAGSIETILSAMRVHSKNAGVQRAGCRALSNLTENYGPAIQRAKNSDAMTTIQGAAVHDPESARRLRERLT